VVSSPTTRGASATTSSAHVAAAAWLASLAILAGQHGVLECTSALGPSPLPREDRILWA
jgi:hypothetical protein